MNHVFSPILRTLPISNKYKAHLQRAGFTTVSEVVLTLPSTLAQLTRLPPQEVEDLLTAISTACSPRPARVSGDEEPHLISLGMPALDDMLGGGIRVGALTEVAGEAGSGKSHLCMHLALSVQLSPNLGGLEGGCIFICSEGIFPSGRMVEIAQSMVERHNLPERQGVESMMNNVHLIKAEDYDSISHAMNYTIPALIEKLATPSSADSPLPIRLIVLDSLAAPLRGTAGVTKDMVKRSKILNINSLSLKTLASRYSLAVLAVNQVADVFRSNWGAGTEHRWRALVAEESTPPSTFEDEAPLPLPPWEMLYATQAECFAGRAEKWQRKEPAMGLAWVNGVNVRLMLYKTGRRVDGGDEREARLIFGPFARAQSKGWLYTITTAGWQGLEGPGTPAPNADEVKNAEDEEEDLWGPEGEIQWDEAMLMQLDEPSNIPALSM